MAGFVACSDCTGQAIAFDRQTRHTWHQPGLSMRIRRPEEIRLNRSANRLRNVARHVTRRMGRDVTPDFFLASNRHTAILKKVPKNDLELYT